MATKVETRDGPLSETKKMNGGRYDTLVEDARRMQHAVLNVRQDLRLMLERRRQDDPTVSTFDEALLTLIRMASDCWNCLQAAIASNIYSMLDAEVDRVAGLIQNMAEAMRTLASLTAPRARRPSQ